ANIRSARLSLYKYSAYNMTYGLHRILNAWEAGSATWNQRTPSLNWGAAGANAAGVDYKEVPDALASVGFSAGWIEFDVTSAVQEMSDGNQNFGWRLRGISGNTANTKKFYTSDYSSN